MNAQDDGGTEPLAKPDEPIGEIAAAIERTPPRNPLDPPERGPVPPIGEIESAIERSPDPPAL